MLMMVTACTKDSDLDSFSFQNESTEQRRDSTFDNEESQNVKKHVKATYSVDDKMKRYIIIITSTLSTVYPNRTIEYQIQGGYGNYYWILKETQ